MSKDKHLSRLMDNDLSEQELNILVSQLTDEDLCKWEQYQLLRAVLAGSLPERAVSLRDEVRQALEHES